MKKTFLSIIIVSIFLNITGCSLKEDLSTSNNIEKEENYINNELNNENNIIEQPIEKKNIIYATNDFSYYEKTFEEKLAEQKTSSEIEIENEKTTKLLNMQGIDEIKVNEIINNNKIDDLPPMENGINFDNIKVAPSN